jgi:DNA-directed RNA polymerase specialized sigma24 family protein
LATVLLGDAGRAEEVVQDAFLRVYRSWWRIRDQDRAQAYLRATVVNLCRSQLRRRMVEDRVNRATWTAEDRQAAAAPLPGSFGIPDDSGAVLALHRQREVVVLYYFEDLSVTAIAGIVGCAGGTVKSQLAKARRHLQQAMEGSSGEVPDA